LPDAVFAFPNQRKEPLTDAKHVRNAVARFDQVEDVSDEDRALAFANIKKAAEHYDVELTRPHGATSAFIRNPIGRKRPPKRSRPNASAARSNRPVRLAALRRASLRRRPA
jgi:hypothetical protein